MLGGIAKCPLIGIVAGIIMFALAGIDLIPLLAKPVDPDETALDRFKKGQHIRAEVYFAYDYLFSDVLTEERDDKTVSSTERFRYYAIPYFEKEADGIYIDRLLLIKVPKTKFGYFEVANERFVKWWTDTNGSVKYPDKPFITLDGVLKPMKDEEQNLVQRYFNGSDSADVVIPYVMEIPNKSEDFACCLAGFMFLALGLFFFYEKRKSLERENRLCIRPSEGNNYDIPCDVTFDNDAE